MEKLLSFLKLSMEIPQPYGWFHLLWFALSIAAAAMLCVLEFDSFNAFFVSPYAEPHLPVYSLVQPLLPFPLALLVYIGGFTLASWLIVQGAMGIEALVRRSRIKAEKRTGKGVDNPVFCDIIFPVPRRHSSAG